MRMPAITGVSPRVLEQLAAGGSVQILIRSSNNLDAVRKLEPGDYVFVTSVGKREVKEGVEGIVATVKSIRIVHERLVSGGPEEEHFEREFEAARIVLTKSGLGSVREVKDYGLGKRTEVEVELRSTVSEAY